MKKKNGEIKIPGFFETSSWGMFLVGIFLEEVESWAVVSGEGDCKIEEGPLSADAHFLGGFEVGILTEVWEVGPFCPWDSWTFCCFSFGVDRGGWDGCSTETIGSSLVSFVDSTF